MNVLDVVYGLLFEPSGAGTTVVTAVLATLLIGTFITGIVIALCGYGYKYRSSAKSVIQSVYSSEDSYETRLKIGNLPSPVLGAWHQYQKTKSGRPGEYLSSEVCVDDPMKMAWLKVLSKLMYLMATASIVFFIGYDIGQITFRTGAALFLGGLVLGMILHLVDKINYDLTLKTHKRLVMALDSYAHTSTVFEQPVYMEKQRYIGQSSGAFNSVNSYTVSEQLPLARTSAMPILTPRGFKSTLDPLGLGVVFSDKKEDQPKLLAVEKKLEKVREVKETKYTPAPAPKPAPKASTTRREPPIIWNAY